MAKFSRRHFVKLSLIFFATLIIDSIFQNVFGKGTINSFPKRAPYEPDISVWSDDDINLAWIGHSTYIINFYGKIILTDPVFSNRIGLYSVLTNLGPKRLVAPAIPPENIPKPDLILLSHAHFDHMDYPTLKYFAQKFPYSIDVITAFNTKDVFEDLPFKTITELDWNETINVNSINIKAYEVKHFGWRYPWENDRSKGFKDGRSYNAYTISLKGKNIFFAGDTAYTELFKLNVKEKIDIALMPIGAYNPWRRAHCTPEEALQMADEIEAKYFLPMHTRTFPHGREPFEEPIMRLKNAQKLFKTKVGLYEVGESFRL